MKDEHITEAMRARVAVLTPSHVVVAARALIWRLRVLHKAYRENGGDEEMTRSQHLRMCEALINFIAIVAAEDACKPVADELRTGFDAAISSAKFLGLV